MATELERVEAVVIGVGWAGGIIAAELAKEGIQVVGLERGMEKSLEDFTMQKDELKYAIRYDLMQDLSKETLTFRNESDQRALPMRQHGSFLLGTDVGGAGVHWNGQCPRFLPYDFEIRSQTVERYGEEKIPEDMRIQDWGLSYDEIEPYYDKFEKMAGVSGEDNELTAPRQNPYPTPPMMDTPMINKFKNTAREMGFHPYHLPSANLSEQYTNPDGKTINACQYCSFCERFGCDYAAKSDPLITVIPTAKDTGNFELRANSNVRRIEYDGERAAGVYYIDTFTQEEFFQPADVVILTAYTMNNNRLLLHSEIGTPYDPETEEGVIGRNYCYQVGLAATGFFEEEKFNIFAGAGALGAAFDDYNGDNFDHEDLDFIHGGMILFMQSGLRPIANNPVPPGTKTWGREFKQQSTKYFTQHLTLIVEGASLPSRNNYLDLDPTYTDEFGDPLLRMTYNFTDQDHALGNHQMEIMEEFLYEMGADDVETLYDFGDYTIVPYQATHNTGGVIMGEDPETSAVNNYLQMWDCENLFVVGGSAFPHNSGYSGVTPTIGALAYRASEGIMQYLENDGGSLLEAESEKKMKS